MKLIALNKLLLQRRCHFAVMLSAMHRHAGAPYCWHLKNTATASTHCCHCVRQCAYAAGLAITAVDCLNNPGLSCNAAANAWQRCQLWVVIACANPRWVNCWINTQCCCSLTDNNWSSVAAILPPHSYQTCLAALVRLPVTVAPFPCNQLVVILIHFLFLSLASLSLLVLVAVDSALPQLLLCRCCFKNGRRRRV